MATTYNPPIVQVYDYSEVKHYMKRYGGAIFGFNRIVRSETVKTELVLIIDCDRPIDKIIINGEVIQSKES